MSDAAVWGRIESWRRDAEILDSYGYDRGAAICRRLAQELEAAVRTSGEELLTLTAAAREAGCTSDHLGRLVRKGTIPNAGRAHAPRIRRRDLPARKERVDSPEVGLYDPAADARGLRGRQGER